ncbi:MULTISPECIES: histidine kinase [unclassified Frankia]|uniref:histidine kinase n=1 Tax=unclassified Frankia TaxID=2632575 RepID=UPI002AD1DCE1|nr:MULTISPECIES: histidine kinase [unclassified Frankia]
MTLENPSAAAPSDAHRPTVSNFRFGHRRGRRLVMLASALVVLRLVEAVVALLTAVSLWFARLDQAAPGVHMVRLAEVRVDPDTAATALVSIVVAGVVAVVLLRIGTVITGFAGIKAVAVVAATAITGVLAPGSATARTLVAAAGTGIVLTLWPRVRMAVPHLLDAAGIHQVSDRAAEIAIIAKMVLLVGVVVLLG